jgi:transposase
MEAEDLATKQQRERYAFERRQEREQQLAAVPYPKRKTQEMNLLSKVSKAAHELLQVYDVMVTAPPITDLAQNVFNESVARLNELCTPTTPVSE